MNVSLFIYYIVRVYIRIGGMLYNGTRPHSPSAGVVCPILTIIVYCNAMGFCLNRCIYVECLLIIIYNIKSYKGKIRKSYHSAGNDLRTVKSVDATIKYDVSKRYR